MKILVTGATGFIGSHLVPFLKERHEVSILNARLVMQIIASGKVKSTTAKYLCTWRAEPMFQQMLQMTKFTKL
ncbi:MAG: NAD(P)-dependent oxidoreductase [Acidimicrobiia bacterium]|nr:NAD(P)-dependent oxidoreductase [Acidimicrobiia bacterium]